MIPFFLSLVALIFGSFVFQFYLPPVLLLGGAAILFVPALFFLRMPFAPVSANAGFDFHHWSLERPLPDPANERARRLHSRVIDSGLSGARIDHARIATVVSQAPLDAAFTAGRNRLGSDSVSFTGAIRYLEHCTHRFLFQRRDSMADPWSWLDFSFDCAMCLLYSHPTIARARLSTGITVGEMT
jgi:hypothetical protein